MTARGFTSHRAWAVQANIGFLGATSPAVWGGFTAAFEHRLRTLGWINGSNLKIDYLWAGGSTDKYAELAEHFVDHQVDVIVTSGTAAVLAAKRATKKIPIIFAAAGDPVATKLVDSLPSPGGNVTGLSNGATNLADRRLSELSKAIPDLQRLAVMGNRSAKVIDLEMGEVQYLAQENYDFSEKDIIPVDISVATEIGPAIKKLKGQADALFVCSDPLLTTHRVNINSSAISAGLPTLHAYRDYVIAGGFMSYGPDFQAMFESAANIVDKVLRGADPGKIPVEMPRRCELYVNRSTAHALGVTIPKGVIKRATVIR